MLIILVLADAFLPSSLFSCRLKGLELSVSSPLSTYSALYQLSGSAALIIIWPHLFGWLGELWFSFCMLYEHRKVGVSIHLAAASLLYFATVILWQQSSCNAVSSDAVLSWIEAIFYRSLPINIKSKQDMALMLPDKERAHTQAHTKNNMWKGHDDKVISRW